VVREALEARAVGSHRVQLGVAAGDAVGLEDDLLARRLGRGRDGGGDGGEGQGAADERGAVHV